MSKPTHDDNGGPSFGGGTPSDGSASAVPAECWRCVELVLESDRDYAGPFGDATVDLPLEGEGGTLTIPAC